MSGMLSAAVGRTPAVSIATPIVVIGTLLALMSPNPSITLLSVAALAWIWLGSLETPIRTIVACYLSFQWLQASALIWLANFFSVDLGEVGSHALANTGRALEVLPTTNLAIAISLVAVSMVSLGTRVLLPRTQALRLEGANFAPSRLFAAYFALLIVDRVSGPFVGGGLAQPLIALGDLRLAFIALLVFTWMSTQRGFWYLAGAIAVDFGLGLLGFFSNFRDVCVTVGIAFAVLYPIYRSRVGPILVSGVFALVLVGAVWTAIKPAYRAALNQGRPVQAVVIDRQEQTSTLFMLISGINQDSLRDGVLDLALRVSYVDAFAAVLQRVPAIEPHARGQLWGQAVGQVARPRFLFPDKPALPSDSERTIKYTGRMYASEADGTSVSIGYVGDSYIDFGVTGALAIPFTLGLLYALAVRLVIYLSREQRNYEVSVATLIVMLSICQQFEISNVKLLAGFLWAAIVSSLFVVVWPHLRPMLVIADTGEPPQAGRPLRPQRGPF